MPATSEGPCSATWIASAPDAKTEPMEEIASPAKLTQALADEAYLSAIFFRSPGSPATLHPHFI